MAVLRALRPLEQLALLLLFGLILLLDPVGAAVIPVDGSCTLVAAVNAANNDDDSGGLCPPGGSGADEIVLTGDVTLTEIDNFPCCPFGCVCGLPVVNSEMTIDGQGHTITRDLSAPAFSIFSVAAPGGILTTNDVTIANATHAVVSNSIVTLNDSTISASADNGLDARDGASLTLNNTTVAGGSTSGIYGNDATLTLNSSTISANDNIGLRMRYGYLTLSDSVISLNSNDGAELFDVTATIVNSTISENQGLGVEAYYYARLTISNSILSGNQGRGIDVSESTMDLFDSTISGNAGDGVRCGDKALVEIVNSTVSGNSGMGLNMACSASLINSTISGNATIGVYSDFYVPNIYNSTIVGNDIGVFANFGTPDLLTNSIVANSVNLNCINIAGVGNLDDDGSCPDAGTITGLDPLLADNGGPTLTHALLAGSSAIDAAGDCGLETDQRLFLRHDGACDTGAYELGGVPSGIFADGFESGDVSAWSATVP